MTLVDVQGLFGGTCLYIDSTTRQLWCRHIGRGCLSDDRSQADLSPDNWQALDNLLHAHNLAAVEIPMHFPVPDEAHAAILLERSDGSKVIVGKWARQSHPDFDPVYKHLLELAEAQRSCPQHTIEGYDPNWRPPGFAAFR